jgi:hypothetical protein
LKTIEIYAIIDLDKKVSTSSAFYADRRGLFSIDKDSSPDKIKINHTILDHYSFWKELPGMEFWDKSLHWSNDEGFGKSYQSSILLSPLKAINSPAPFSANKICHQYGVNSEKES